jgi:hypothetical protein
VHLVKKPNGKWRFCLDFRSLNEVATPMSWPFPSIKLMLDRLGEKKQCFFATMDLTSGYFQAPIAPEARAYKAFRTDSGVFQWKRVPMGLKGAASYFQEAMVRVIGPDLLHKGVELYLDDVIVYGTTQAEYLSNLNKLFARFERSVQFVLGTEQVQVQLASGRVC